MIADAQPYHSDAEAPAFCVYLLIRKSVVIYVGATIHLHKRITKHRAAKVDFDEIKVLPYESKGAMLANERRLISELSPELNGDLHRLRGIYPVELGTGERATLAEIQERFAEVSNIKISVSELIRRSIQIAGPLLLSGQEPVLKAVVLKPVAEVSS